MECPVLSPVQQTLCESSLNPIHLNNIIESCKEFICGLGSQIGFDEYEEKIMRVSLCLTEKAITELNPSEEFKPEILKTIANVANNSAQLFGKNFNSNSDSCTIFSNWVSTFNDRLNQEQETSGIVDRVSGFFGYFSHTLCVLNQCSPNYEERVLQKMKSMCPHYSISSTSSNSDDTAIAVCFTRCMTKCVKESYATSEPSQSSECLIKCLTEKCSKISEAIPRMSYTTQKMNEAISKISDANSEINQPLNATSQESYSLNNVLSSIAISILVVGGLTFFLPKLTRKLFPFR